jgi:16S rRNA (adenine1518-N6/adenine1519-N6)-dimethyltransferase
VFVPVPNVDSVLVELRRHGPAADPAVRGVVQAAFAHRRKALPRSLALARPDEPDLRDRAREALAALGLRQDARAETLTPSQFAQLAARLER